MLIPINNLLNMMAHDWRQLRTTFALAMVSALPHEFRTEQADWLAHDLDLILTPWFCKQIPKRLIRHAAESSSTYDALAVALFIVRYHDYKGICRFSQLKSAGLLGARQPHLSDALARLRAARLIWYRSDYHKHNNRLYMLHPPNGYDWTGKRLEKLAA